MILGTHNSLTSYPLKGWFCKLIKCFCDITAKCQDLTIPEQLQSGIRLFNIQINQKNGEWIGSHGIAWYDINIFDTFQMLNDFALSTKENIYVILDYDKHLFVKPDVTAFKNLVKQLQKEYKKVKIVKSVIEYNKETFLSKRTINFTSRYWMLDWAKQSQEAKQFWYRYLPYPRFWAKKLNNYWIEKYQNEDYLIIDFA